ncbi:MAG: alpha/beta fold hydrolase [Flavobacteriales bacterium]|jgi:proline iminopeptidase
MKKLILLLLLIPLFSFGQSIKSFNSDDGTEIFYQDIGKGKTIVLLSGGPGLNSDYLKVLYTELQKKYRCIILHQRGTGKSILKEINDKTVNVDRYIEDLNGLYNHLGGEKLTLVGHSWGGMLSFSYAANEPNKIEKIILLNTGGITDDFYNWFGSNINMRLYSEDLELQKSQIENKRETLVAIWPGYFFSREMALKTRPALDYKFRNQKGINSLAAGDWRKRSDERIKKLKSFKAPVDLIAGRQDPIGESVVYEVKSILKQTNYFFIEECGHFPWLEGDKQSKIFYDLFDKSVSSLDAYLEVNN